MEWDHLLGEAESRQGTDWGAHVLPRKLGNSALHGNRDMRARREGLVFGQVECKVPSRTQKHIGRVLGDHEEVSDSCHWHSGGGGSKQMTSR